jgi:hypothetical protein
VEIVIGMLSQGADRNAAWNRTESHARGRARRSASQARRPQLRPRRYQYGALSQVAMDANGGSYACMQLPTCNHGPSPGACLPPVSATHVQVNRVERCSEYRYRAVLLCNQ